MNFENKICLTFNYNLPPPSHIHILIIASSSVFSSQECKHSMLWLILKIILKCPVNTYRGISWCPVYDVHIYLPFLTQEVSSCCLRNAEVPRLNLTNTPYFCMSIGCFWCGGNIIKKVFNKIMFGKLLYKFPTFVYNFRVAVHIMYLCTYSRYKYLGLFQGRICGGLWQARCIQSVGICWVIKKVGKIGRVNWLM